MHPKNRFATVPLYDSLFSEIINQSPFKIDSAPEEISENSSKKPMKINSQSESEVLPVPEYILPDGLTTVVKWTDGTKTVVRLSEGCEDQYDIYMAYLAALGKKLYGSTAKLHRVVETHTVDYLNEQKCLEVEKRRKEAEELAKKRHRQKVKAEVKKQMLAAEAYQEIMERIARLSKFEE